MGVILFVVLYQAIEDGSDASVCLLNYRADSTTFWNQFFVAALRDGAGSTVNYVGVQCKVRFYAWDVYSGVVRQGALFCRM